MNKNCCQFCRDQCVKCTPDYILPVASVVRKSILCMAIIIVKTLFYFPPLITRGFFLLLFAYLGGQTSFTLLSSRLRFLQLWTSLLSQHLYFKHEKQMPWPSTVGERDFFGIWAIKMANFFSCCILWRFVFTKIPHLKSGCLVVSVRFSQYSLSHQWQFRYSKIWWL